MRRSLALVSIACCLGFAACGGDDDDEQAATTVSDPTATTTQSDPAEAPDDRGDAGGEQTPEEDPADAIRTALEQAIESGDPELACDAAVTSRYLRDAYGGPGGCRDAQSQGLAAKIVEVGEIEISGDTAGTTVRAQGGPYTGERLEAELLFVDGDWRLDRLVSNVPVGP